MPAPVTPNPPPSSYKKRRTVSEREDALRRLEDGADINLLARELGVTAGCIRKWRGKATKLSQFDGDHSAVTTMRPCMLPEMEAKVFDWVVQQRTLHNRPVQRSHIQAQALSVNEELGGPVDFRASAGWYSNFIKRRGLHQLETCGVALSADKPAAAAFVRELPAFLEENEV